MKNGSFRLQPIILLHDEMVQKNEFGETNEYVKKLKVNKLLFGYPNQAIENNSIK